MTSGRRRALLVGATCAAAIAVVTGLALRRVEPFHTWFYQWAWYLFLPIIEAGVVLTRGRPALKY